MLIGAVVKLSDFYIQRFGCKAYKLALDAGCTCPNRDGTKGTGGCVFCSARGSGDFAPSALLPVPQQVEQARLLVQHKLAGRSGTRQGVYIAYFQNFTSTYGNAAVLKEKYLQALSQPGVRGLAVATRPDCIDDELLSFFAQIAEGSEKSSGEKRFVQIELGLQTSNERTAALINRCYGNAVYVSALERIRRASPLIHTVTHLIFGLPGETEQDMLESVRFTAAQNGDADWGIKFTVLYILHGTVLADWYRQGRFRVMDKDTYIRLLHQAVLLLPERCIIHRLTGDPPKDQLIAPLWTADKKRVLNDFYMQCSQIN